MTMRAGLVRFLLIYALFVLAVLAGLSMLGCSAPDEVGVQTGYGEMSGAGPRPWLSGEAESWWVVPYAQWNIGQEERHGELVELMRAERRLLERIRDALAQSVPVIVHDDHAIGPPLPPPEEEESNLTTLLVGGIVAGMMALVAAIKMLTGRKPKEDDDG